MLEPFECDALEFYDVCEELVNAGAVFRLEVRGWSMYPLLKDRDVVEIAPIDINELRIGDVVFFRSGKRLLAHRIVGFVADEQGIRLRVRGDSYRQEDPPVAETDLIGRVEAVERNGCRGPHVIPLDKGSAKWLGRLVAQSGFVHGCVRWGGRGMWRVGGLARRLLAMGRVTRALIFVAVSVLILAAAADGAIAQSSGAGFSQESGQEPEIRVVETSWDRVVLDVIIPVISTSTEWVGGRAYETLSVPGWGLIQEAGTPRLPTHRVLLGIPPEAKVHLKVLDVVVRESEAYRVIPVPEKVLQTEQGPPAPFGSPGSWPTGPEFSERFVESPAVYGVDAFYPNAVAQLAEDGFVRSQRVVAVDLQPVQYNPVSEKIRFHSQFRVELSFFHPHDRQSTSIGLLGPGGTESSGYEQLLQEHLLNYTLAKEWRGGSAELFQSAMPLDWPLSVEAHKIMVTENGVHKLSYQDLVSAGVPLASGTIDPREIQIFWMGEEIAIQVAGEGDGSFDQDDHVLFFGQGIRSKYTDRNVYWLTYGQAMGRRMPERSGQPSGSLVSPTFFSSHARIEEDKDYFSLWPGDDSTDRWYWERRIAYTDVSTDVIAEVDLGQVSVEPEMASLQVVMMSRNEFGTVNPDHHAVFYVNGHLVGEHWWDGMDQIEAAQVDFPQSYLVSGMNTLRTVFPGDTGAYVEYLLFDRYELSYGHAYEADSDRLVFTQSTSGSWEYEVEGFTRPDIRVYDISDPLTVAQIVSPAIEPAATDYTLRFADTVPTTKTYLVLTPDHWLSPDSISLDSPSNLHDSANGADYIILSHADFLPAAQRLATYRAGRGLRTIVVDVEDVYDEFGYGLCVPHAIRDFVRYAYESWQDSAPTYVVLLGDGTYDPKNNVDEGMANYVTPYLAFVDEWLGETATDNWYVAVVGEDSIWPDLILGRMPANTLAEANTMVDKTMFYEQSLGGTNWTSRLVFVAGRQPDPKWAGNFHDLSEAVIKEYVPSFYDVSRVYLGAIPGATCASGADCKGQLVTAINSGALLVNFVGHGSVIQWDGSYIFDHDAISRLANADRFPVMLPMTCLEGLFTNPSPEFQGLSESVVRAEGKGAVASWGPTGLGVAYGHDELNRGFLEALLSRGVREFGPATYAGKLRLYNAGHSLEQIQEYTVFGDPALHVHSLDVVDLRVEKFADAPEEIEPGDLLTFTLTFINTGPDTAIGVVLTDLIPSVLINPTVVYSSPEVIAQQAGTPFSWTIANLLPHSGGEVVVRAQVRWDAEVPVAFFNRAEIASSTPDLALWNNRTWIGVGTSRIYLPIVLHR